jgi:tRNA U34 2-thiouridine synthase MnmA/TrmU
MILTKALVASATTATIVEHSWIEKLENRTIRALGLCSGGLDSMLAALVLRDQGIDVTWITFETPFFSAHKAKEASKITGVPLMVENITHVYLKMLKKPPAGYGKHMNPCMDCHTLMFKLAGEKMRELKFDFLFSGEVLQQRPMSQTRSSLQYVAKHSGLGDLIVRPLTAQHLPETAPEKKGWVDRSRLLKLAGRSRKPQIALAAKYGIKKFPTPAGCCLLTDKGYSDRLRDLFAHVPDPTENELHLLRIGRHFRLNESTKLIIGRTQKENRELLQYWDSNKELSLKTRVYPGPTAVLSAGASQENIQLAAAICAGYSKAKNLSQVTVAIRGPEGLHDIMVAPIRSNAIKDQRI